MKPPICVVCNDDVDPDAGALVTCADDDRSEAFRHRAEQPGFVGHPPNQGWFCAEHLHSAEILAPNATLSRVIEVVRRNAGYRVCDVCGIEFFADTGGAATFAPTDAGTEWRQARSRSRETGPDPDVAWLCNRHVNPALRIGRRQDRAVAMRELCPDGREPLEYDDVPPSADPERNETRPPLRGPFRPVANNGLAKEVDRWRPLGAHPPEMVARVLHDTVPQIGLVFSELPFRNGGSKSSASQEAIDLRWAPNDTVTSSGVSSYQCGDVAIFAVGVTHWQGDRKGPIVGGHHRILVQQRERSIWELTVAPAEPASTAPDGLALLERMLVRAAPDLDAEMAERLDAVVENLADQLGAEPPDPLDPAPDLTDVDLGSGTIRRNHGGDTSSIEWHIGDRSVRDATDTLVAAVPQLLLALESEETVELKQTTRRDWTPMDRTYPPNCPFSDTTDWKGAVGDLEVHASYTSNQWSEGDVSNQHAFVSIVGAKQPRIWLYLHDNRNSRSFVRGTTLSLGRPTNRDVVAVVRALFDETEPA